MNPDEEIIEYIKELKFRKKLIGADPEDLWVVISNIQKYYGNKTLELEAVIKEKNEEIASLYHQNTKLRMLCELLKKEKGKC